MSQIALDDAKTLQSWKVFMPLLANPRQTYLIETLGLSHDPFAGPVAEQELHSSELEPEPHIFSYYNSSCYLQ